MQVWAIIPVRGGSKRLPKKNLMPLHGKSLLRRAVETSINSNCFSRVVVSTDDLELANEARNSGAEVPFTRPNNLAKDDSSSVDVLVHAVSEMTKNDKVLPDIICLIQATSPFLQPYHIKEAIELMLNSNYDSLSSMKLVREFPEWMYKIDPESKRANTENADGITKSRQEIPPRYIENGAIYLVRRKWLIDKKSLYNFTNHGGYIMSEIESIDIDTADDFAYADMLVKQHKSEQ